MMMTMPGTSPSQDVARRLTDDGYVVVTRLMTPDGVQNARADLVLLDANPVESVEHLHRISGVVRGGRYLGPADLGALKEKVAAARSAR